MVRLLIVPGPSSSQLARQIAGILGTHVVDMEFKQFPDGDSYFRFKENVQGESLSVIQSTYPPQDRNMMQLFLMLEGLKDLGCREIRAIVPYLAYMRQDKRFLDGEVVSANAILRMIRYFNVDELLTVDIHNKDVLTPLGSFARDLSAMPRIADWIRRQDWERPLVIAPDKGAAHRAEIVSLALLTDFAVGHKTRDRTTGKVTSEFDKSVVPDGRRVVIIDDTIARGDTVIKATEIMLHRGAEKVFAVCTHGLFLDDAVARMRDAGVEDVICTDTIPTGHSKITVAPVIADALKSTAA